MCNRGLQPNKFIAANRRFREKYTLISELNQLEDANYNSLKELEQANVKLEELKTKMDRLNLEKDNEVVNAYNKASDDIQDQIKITKEIERIENTDQSIKDEKKKLEDRQKEIDEYKKDHGIVDPKQVGQVNQAMSDGANDLDKLNETFSGHVSIKDMADAASQINKGYDQTIRDLSTITYGSPDTGYLEAWAKIKFGDELYNAASAIKRGASDAISGVDDMLGLKDTFGGKWSNPLVAANKIRTGLNTIQNAVTNVSKVANNVLKSLNDGKGSELLDKLNLADNQGFKVLGTATSIASAGIGSFYSFANLDIATGIGGIASGINQYHDAVSKWKQHELDIDKDQYANKLERMAQKNVDSSELLPSSSTSEIQDSSQLKEKNSLIKGRNTDFSTSRSGESQSNSNASEDNYSADMISEINVVLDGSSSSKNSLCTINGNEYRLSGYSLSQELLQPMFLSFSIEKEDKIETDADVVFTDATQIIGKSLEIKVSTIKTSQDDGKVSPQKAFVFKGMIINVSASRATASSQSASVTVATWDAMLQNAPHCRSFENMTLKEIIDSVLKPYGEIQSKVSPRFKEKIPYIVQYNQSDYAFITMLAIRFGEWMYNTGETFVFGEMDNSNASEASLEYPGGSLMSYNLRQNMNTFMFNHLLPDHYQFGKEKGILKESAKGLADGKVNNWTEMAYNASIQRFNNEQIAAIGASGFDSGKEDEGADTILDYSLKIEAQGKKTGMMTVQGFSKLAMLKMGQTFQIHDNVQNKSGESKDVKQNSLKIIGINHSFDYRQEYSNSFTAIPVACNYPSYSDADVFPSAPQQRAKVVENKDEQKLGRIRVQFPWQEIQSKDMKTPWLRIAVPYAGASKGHQFIPEIGEEVMVGFEMNNAEKPYIIGALYNGGKGKPDEEWAASKDDDGTNTVKAIRTRNGHTIEIHDKGNDGYIRIYDNKKENYILTFSTDEKLIKLESTGNIELYAKNDIIMQAGHDIRVQAGHDRNTSVGRNDSLSVGSNQFVKIGANKDEQVANQLQVSAQNIRVEAGMSLNEYSTTHNINALAEVSITSTGPTNIKSKILKAN